MIVKNKVIQEVRNKVLNIGNKSWCVLQMLRQEEKNSLASENLRWKFVLGTVEASTTMYFPKICKNGNGDLVFSMGNIAPVHLDLHKFDRYTSKKRNHQTVDSYSLRFHATFLQPDFNARTLLDFLSFSPLMS